MHDLITAAEATANIMSTTISVAQVTKDLSCWQYTTAWTVVASTGVEGHVRTTKAYALETDQASNLKGDHYQEHSLAFDSWVASTY